MSSELEKYSPWFSAITLPIIGIYICGKTLVAYFPNLMKDISNIEIISLGGRLPESLRVSSRELIAGFGIQSLSILIFIPFRFEVMQIFLAEFELSRFPWNAYLCFTSLVAIVLTVIPAIAKAAIDSYKESREKRIRKQDEVRRRTDENELMRM